MKNNLESFGTHLSTATANSTKDCSSKSTSFVKKVFQFLVLVSSGGDLGSISTTDVSELDTIASNCVSTFSNKQTMLLKGIYSSVNIYTSIITAQIGCTTTTTAQPPTVAPAALTKAPTVQATVEITEPPTTTPTPKTIKQ